MVIVNKEYRYFRRFEKRSVPITEEEIRRKYEEVGLSQKAIELRKERIIAGNLERIKDAKEVGLLSIGFTPLSLEKGKLDNSI